DKPPSLSLYRTVHEIFTSYDSSFNSFKGILFLVESLRPSSTSSRRLTKTN
uniref:Uncharacterized protein n=1 Tax=Oryza brachyantha TaxID=4533 RepID=J3L336_ORYBR